jgi:hypothetical protein
MKPLTATKITPATKNGIGDWIPAKDQATVGGLQDFAQRQRARMEAAQAAREKVVTPIKRRGGI